MKRRLFLLGSATASLCLSLPVSAQTKWDLPAGYPAGNPHTQNLTQFAADVAKATGGKLAITVHPGGALFKAPEIKRAVQTGQAQIGEVLMSLLENENPVLGADAIPFVATGFDASYKLWQAQRPIAEKALAAQGIKLLYAVAWPPQGIYTKKQLNSTADMKGLKWRAYNPATTRIAAMVRGTSRVRRFGRWPGRLLGPRRAPRWVLPSCWCGWTSGWGAEAARRSGAT